MLVALHSLLKHRIRFKLRLSFFLLFIDFARGRGNVPTELLDLVQLLSCPGKVPTSEASIDFGIEDVYLPLTLLFQYFLYLGVDGVSQGLSVRFSPPIERYILVQKIIGALEIVAAGCFWSALS